MIDQKILAEIAKFTNSDPRSLELSMASHGHMAYQHLVIINKDTQKNYFAKIHDSQLFNDAERARHSLEYLKKEFLVTNKLTDANFNEVLKSNLIDCSLIMPALLEQNGWNWELPKDLGLQAKYIDDVLESLSKLSTLGFDIDSSVPPSYDSLLQLGWNKMQKSKHSVKDIRNVIDYWHNDLHPSSLEIAQNLLRDYPDLLSTTKPGGTELENFAHFDARQHNIAWHPEHGVRIVDWSWAGYGLKNTDTTQFLIDLAKSGVSIDTYLAKYFNRDHALVMMGYWLARSLEPPSELHPKVRLHQLASALTAYSLID